MKRARAVSEITFGDEKLPPISKHPEEATPIEQDEEQEKSIPVGSIQAVRFLDSGEVEEQARIKVRIEEELVDSTVGRVILSEILPPSISFSHVWFLGDTVI